MAASIDRHDQPGDRGTTDSRHRVDDLCEIPRSTRRLLPSQFATLLARKAGDARWDLVASLLATVERHSALHSGSLSTIVHSIDPETRASTLNSCVRNGAPIELLDRLLALGLQLEQLSPGYLLGGAFEERTSALHVAAAAGSLPWLHALLDRGHSAKLQMPDGTSALMLLLKAMPQGEPLPATWDAAIQRLAEEGANLHALDSSGINPILLSVSSRNWPLLERLFRLRLSQGDTRQAPLVTRSEMRAYATHALAHGAPQALTSEWNTLSRELPEKSAVDTDPFEDHWRDSFLRILPSAEAAVSSEARWEASVRLAEGIAGMASLFPSSVRDVMLNRQDPMMGVPIDEGYKIFSALGLSRWAENIRHPSLLHRWVELGAPAPLLKQGVELGADTAALAFFPALGQHYAYTGETPFVTAATLGNKEAMLCLRPLTASDGQRDINGETPLRRYWEWSRRRGTPDLEVVKALLVGFPEDIDDVERILANNNVSESLRRMIREAVLAEQVHELTQRAGSHVRFKVYHKGGTTQDVSPAEFAEVVIEGGVAKTLRHMRITSSYRSDSSAGPDSSRSNQRSISHPSLELLYEAYLYQKAELFASTPSNWAQVQENWEPLARLLPALLFRYRLEASRNIVNSIERTMDRMAYLSGPAWHPNMAEMLALLRHPHDATRSSHSIGWVTTGITSVSRWINSVSSTLVDAWSRAGVLTHSFQNLRFDAESYTSSTGGRLSLLEAFGLTRISGRSTDYHSNASLGHFLGPGFARIPGSGFPQGFDQDRLREVDEVQFDRETFVELRRAYLLVAHPELGALLIRNSSRVFGRDLLRHPAYYTPDSFSPARLLKLIPGHIEAWFTDITKREALEHAPRILRLAEQLEALLREYQRWKFDTSEYAWEKRDDGSSLLRGGYLSPGFSALCEYLVHKIASVEREGKGVIPDLAFVNPYYPPWAPFVRLRISQESLDIMRRLATGGFVSEEEFNESDLRKFFQDGMTERAALVMLARDENVIR